MLAIMAALGLNTLQKGPYLNVSLNFLVRNLVRNDNPCEVKTCFQN